MIAPSTRSASLLLGLALAGCVASEELVRDRPRSEADGRADDASSTTLAPSVRTVLASDEYLGAIDALSRAGLDGARTLSLVGYTETREGDAISLRLAVRSETRASFPVVTRREGTLDATLVAAGEELRVEALALRSDDRTFEPSAGIDATTAAVVADGRYVAALRTLREEHPDLRIGSLLATVDDLVIEVETLDALASSGWREIAEVVARVHQSVESGATVDSLDLWRDGVVIRDRYFVAASDSFFPGNGYFVLDDAELFLASFWAAHAGTHVSPPSAPHIADDEMVVGVITSYFPYAGKSMQVEAVEQLDDRVVVGVALRWDGFGCFEVVGDVQLIEVIEIPRTDLPIEIRVTSTTGHGCGTPPGRAREDAVTIGDEARNQFHVCETDGSFAPPFERCSARSWLDPRNDDPPVDAPPSR
jgi:hypothetical protein